MKKRSLFFILAILIIMTLIAGCSQNSKEVSSNTYAVSGIIVDKNGIGIEGIKIHFSGNHGSATTDSKGNWYKSGLSGRVIITPVDEKYRFTPENLVVTSKATGLKFIALDSIPSPIILYIPRVSTNSTELVWTEVEEANNYEIYRSTDNIDYIKIDVTDKTSYIDNELEADTKYYYKIKAINTDKGLESNLSDYMAIKTPTVGEMIIDKNIKVFSEEEMDSILIEKTNTKVVLKKNPKTNLLEEGNMIFSEYSREKDVYLNHKIVSIEKTEDKIIIYLIELDIEELVDIIGDASFSHSIDNTISLDTIKQHQVKIADYIKQDLKLQGTVNVSIEMVGKTLELKVTHLPLDYPVVEESITLYVENSFETIFNKSRWLFQMQTGFRVKFDFGLGTTVNTDLWLAVLEKEELGVRWTIAEIPLAKSLFHLGIIPVYVSMDLPVELFLNGEIRGSTYLSYGTPEFIQELGFDIKWDNFSESELIYKWKKRDTEDTGINIGFMFEGDIKLGLSESFTLSIYQQELIKGGIEQYLAAALSYEASQNVTSKGMFDKNMKIDAILRPGKDAEKVLKGISSIDLSFNKNLFTLNLGKSENYGPTLKVEKVGADNVLLWNQSRIFTFLGDIETNQYKILRKSHDKDDWKVYRTINKTTEQISTSIDDGGYYKVIPQFNFFGVDYPGLESNTVYVFYEKPVVNQPPIIEIKELYEDFHPVATLEGFVKDDEKVEEVIIDWGDGNREKIIENFDYIYREHLYETTGDFRITVKAIDNRGAFSIETISDVSITKLTTSTVNAGPDEYIIVEKNLNLPSSLGGQEVQSISPTKNYLLRKDATAYLRAAYKVPAYGEYSGDPWETIHYKVFDCWGGDLEGTENHVRLVLDRDKKVIAYFKDIYFEPPAGTNYIKIINHLYQSYSPWMSAIKVYPKEIVRHICDNIYYYSPGTRVCIEYIFDVDELEYAPFNYEYFPFNPDDDDEAWLLENLNIIIRGESGARYTGSDGIVDAVFLWEEGKIYLYVTLVENMIVEKK